tara:strand:- start:39 stop:599 length:561 start_codon:yes stop_codon:yes gene_type:complete
MPIPATPSPILPPELGLNASGDSSSCEFADWHVHNQVINGMYQRVFVYDNAPSMANGVLSGAPRVLYSYIDCNFSVQVTEEKELASYCSGLYVKQGLTVMSDSVVGGLGLSGVITTSATGYARRKWILNTDVESNCQQTANVVIGKIPGEYNSTYDTSATAGSHIAQLLMACETQCTTFSQNLVDY